MLDKSKFIVFEGLDGSGKTTQINMLANYLNNKNILTKLTKEPGGTTLGNSIRDLILADNDDLDALSEFLLFSTSRYQNIKSNIEPWLNKGYTVLSDRFYLSSYAYQVYAGGLDFEFAKTVTNKIVGQYQPDITILLNIDVNKGINRSLNNTVSENEKRFENKEIAYHNKVKDAFMNMAAENNNIIVINAEQDTLKVHQDITEALQEKGII